MVTVTRTVSGPVFKEIYTKYTAYTLPGTVKVSAGSASDVIEISSAWGIKLRIYGDAVSPSKTLQRINAITGNFIVEDSVRCSSLGSGNHAAAIGLMDADAADGNGFFFFFYFDGTNRYWRSYKRTTGLWTLLNTSAQTWSTGTFYSVTLKRSGTTVTCYVGGTQIYQYTLFDYVGANLYYIVGRIWNEASVDAYEPIFEHMVISPNEIIKVSGLTSGNFVELIGSDNAVKASATADVNGLATIDFSAVVLRPPHHKLIVWQSDSKAVLLYEPTIGALWYKDIWGGDEYLYGAGTDPSGYEDPLSSNTRSQILDVEDPSTGFETPLWGGQDVLGNIVRNQPLDVWDPNPAFPSDTKVETAVVSSRPLDVEDPATGFIIPTWHGEDVVADALSSIVIDVWDPNPTLPTGTRMDNVGPYTDVYLSFTHVNFLDFDQLRVQTLKTEDTLGLLDKLPYKISGVTKDSAGNPLGSCIVRLIRAKGGWITQETVSDGTGNYTFYIREPTTEYFVDAFKAGTPNVMGSTVRTLKGEAV